MDEYNNQASESFWEIGKYNRTVKRIENSSKLCDSLRQLIETRSDIEKSYAKQLSQWSRKWNDFLEKGKLSYFVTFLLQLLLVNGPVLFIFVPAGLAFAAVTDYFYVTIFCK